MTDSQKVFFPESLTIDDIELAWEHVRRSKRWEVKDWLALRIYGYPPHKSKYLSFLLQKLRQEEYSPGQAYCFYHPKTDRSLRRFAFLDMDDRLVYQLLCNILIANSFDDLRKLNRENRVFGNMPIDPVKKSFYVLEPPFNIRLPNGGMHNGQYELFRYRVLNSYKEFVNEEERPWLVRADIRSYFPSIDHSLLADLIEKRNWMQDTSASNLLFKCLAKWTPDQAKGIPVGYECSDYMGNLYLYDLDMKMEHCRIHRYVDDIYIFVKSFEDAKEVIHRIDLSLDSLRLQRNTSKTEIFCLRDLPFQKLKKLLSENLSMLARKRLDRAAEERRQDDLIRIWRNAYNAESESNCFDGTINDIRQVAFVLNRLCRKRTDVQEIAYHILDHDLQYVYQALKYLYRNYGDERFTDKVKSILKADYEPRRLKGLSLEFLQKLSDPYVMHFISDLIAQSCKDDWHLIREVLQNVFKPEPGLVSTELLRLLIASPNPHVEAYARWLLFEITENADERRKQIHEMFTSEIQMVNVLGIQLTDLSGLHDQLKKTLITSDLRNLFPDRIQDEIEEFHRLFTDLFKIELDRRFRVDDYIGNLSASLLILRSLSANRLTSGTTFIKSLYSLVESLVISSVNTENGMKSVDDIDAALRRLRNEELGLFVSTLKGELTKEYLEVRTQLELLDRFKGVFGSLFSHWHIQEGLLVRDEVFICYAHDDNEWMHRFMRQLKPYIRNKTVKAWSDKEIDGGDRWKDEIMMALNRARVAVLLVTPSFMASDFIQDTELHNILKASRKDGLVIRWIHVIPSAYHTTELAEIQAAHCNIERTLEQMDNEGQRAEYEQVLVEIWKKISQLMQSPA